MSEPSPGSEPLSVLVIETPDAPLSWPATLVLLAFWLAMVVALGMMLGLLAAFARARGGLDGAFQALGFIGIGFWGAVAAGAAGAVVYCAAGRPRETGVKALAATGVLDLLALVALMIAQAARG